MVGLAVFVLSGSWASRVLGSLAALSGLAQLLVPFVVVDTSPQVIGALAVPWVAAIALHVATIVALVRPSPTKPGSG